MPEAVHHHHAALAHQFESLEQQKDAAKGKKMVEFLNWALAKGEGMAAALDYAPLPEELQKRVLERVKTIRY